MFTRESSTNLDESGRLALRRLLRLPYTLIAKDEEVDHGALGSELSPHQRKQIIIVTSDRYDLIFYLNYYGIKIAQ